MALSKAVGLYNVRLAKVKVVKTQYAPNLVDAVHPEYQVGGMQVQGGGYEFQFLDGQQRANRAEELLTDSAIVLVSKCRRLACSKADMCQTGKCATTLFLRN